MQIFAMLCWAGLAVAAMIQGSPVDADKSHFESFAKNFKLPVRHYQLERLRGNQLAIII